MAKRKKTSSGTAKVIYWILIGWWLCLFKLLLWDLPASIIKHVSDKNRFSDNYNEYSQYAPGDLMPKRYTKEEAKRLAPIYLNQLQDSGKIINSTTNPETFFYRYGFALQRLTELEKMEKLVKFKGSKPSKTKIETIKIKQESIRELINRMKDKVDEKLSSLKTQVSIINNINKFNNPLNQN